MKKNILILMLLLLLPLVLLTARGQRDNNDNYVIEVTGRIKIKGSDPHTSVVLVTEDNVVYILVGEKSLEIRENYQLKLLEVKAKMLKPAEPLLPAELDVISFKVLK